MSTRHSPRIDHTDVAIASWCIFMFRMPGENTVNALYIFLQFVFDACALPK